MEWVLFIELVEVLITNLRSDRWNVTRGHFSKLVPIKSLEEWMCFDLIGSVSSKSGVSVAYESLKNISRCWRQLCLSWNLESFLPVHNLLTGDRWLIWKEWWVTNKHLEEDATHTPPIYCLVISVLTKDLWSDVVWSTNSTEGKLPSSLVAKFLV